MTQKNLDTIWTQTLALLKETMNEQTYRTWIEPVRLMEMRDDSMVIGVPNKFFKDWIEEHYTEVIREGIARVSGVNRAVSVAILPEDAGSATRDHAVPPPAVSAQEKTQDEGRKQLFPFFFKKTPTVEESSLNALYTMENFVVGPSNRFAHAAALAVSDSPAKAYNPLFIYGKVGLGKTHLMQAIGHRILSVKPQLKFIYISSEKFTNQLIGAIQNRNTIKFRQMYRNVDLLLIDDIHFIAGKESTQEEFFHTFNALYDAHKQIVVSSDRSPKDIPALEERLISRFEWGLVTDIQPPDIETRIAILRKKAEKEGVRAPDEVTVFIAEKIKSNIRELEGALIRVAAYAKLMGTEITLNLVKDILKDVLIESEKKITIELIQKKVAQYFDIRLSDMKAKRRTKAIAYPRQIAMFLSRELTDYSLPEIGEHFGGRDHSTVLHACEKIQKNMSENAGSKELIKNLKENINS